MRSLTKALQALVAAEKDPHRPPVEVPTFLNLSALKLSKEVNTFLEEQASYRLRTKNIAVGEYQ